MITRRNSKLLLALTAACVFSAAYGQQSEKTKRQLWFEVASGNINISKDFSEVKYIGYFHVKTDRTLRPWIGTIQTTSKWNLMSEEQQQFIIKLQNDDKYRSIESRRRTGYPFFANVAPDYVITPKGTRTYSVYGVSKEDVRKMAEAVIEVLDNEAQQRLEKEQKNLERSQKTIAETEKMLPKLEAEYKQLEAKAEEKTKEYAKTNYAIDIMNREETLNYARKKIEELASYLSSANFELIGLQAKINSIERFKASGNISDQSTLIKLDQMLIADEIERAGTMARRNAYENVFKQTKELYDLFMSSNDAASKIQSCESRLNNARMHKSRTESLLSNPRKEMQPVEIYENKVVIMQAKPG